MIVKHTEEFDLAYRFVTETNQNIFLTGKAGTGKTTFLKYLRENSLKKNIVTAPTGVAAINARGVTLHSFFQLPFGIILPEQNLLERSILTVKNHPFLSKIRYNKEKLNLLQSLELLIIDEASMVASYTVDAIDTILRYIRRNFHQPFGGVQLLFIGDLYQLPPVVKKDEWEILQNYYSSIFFFDSFVLRNNNPVIIELKEIFRQQDNKFIDILNGIRNNNITEENFKLLNSRINKEFTPLDNEGYITLTTHNFQSAEINNRKLNNLSEHLYTFYADIKDDFPEHIFPAEKELRLKKGAQVMFLKNDTEGKQYFNGKIGIIIKLDENSIKVKCKGDPDVIEVKKSEWQNVNYKLNPDTREITEEVLGTFIQYPLRLAWAITIHKSQGLTFDKIVIDAARAFATGQVYVALSRCTTLEGLVLKTPVYRNFLGAHRDFKEWLIQNWNANLSQLFTESRQNFIIEELQNIFTFENYYYALKALREFLLENQIMSPKESSETKPESYNWIKGLIEKQNELRDVSEKFKKMISRLSKEKLFIEENDILQKRIRDGAIYFSNEICKWHNMFIDHPLSISTKKLSDKVDAMLDEINLIVEETQHKIDYFKNGFLLDDFMKKGKFFNGNIKKIKSSYSKRKVSSLLLKNIKHPELYKMLLNMRSRISETKHLHFSEIFSNNAIRNVCENLPSVKHEVINITGFGNGKGNRYGSEIASIVREYCSVKNINSSDYKPEFNKTTDMNEVSSTIFETIHLLNEGNKIEEIANKRNLEAGTIESHLMKAISRDLIKIDEVMSISDAKKIAEYFPMDLSEVRLASIKEKAPPEISYGQLKMVFAWLQKGNN